MGLTGSDAQLYAGSQDNDILQYPLGSTGAAQWNELATGSANADGGQVAVDPTNNAIVYAEQSWGELYRSEDGGNSWTQVGGDATSGTPGVNGLNACPNNSEGLNTTADCDATNFVMPFVLAPTNHDELFAATNQVYRSTNDGQSWTPLSSFASQDGNSPLSAIAVGLQSDKVLYVGDNNGNVYTSTDGGATWITTDLRNMTAKGMVTGLAIDPLNASVVYATIANFADCAGASACGEHIFRSADGGYSWQDLDPVACLPNTPFDAVVVDPLDDHTLFVGTDAGIFATTDFTTIAPSGSPCQGGVQWEQLVGLPNVAVEQLFTDSTGKYLYVATHGRGLWRVPLISGTVYTSLTQTLAGNPSTYAQLVIADDALTGARLWTAQVSTANGGYGPLQLANNTLYVMGQDGSVWALDPGSGRVIWQDAPLAPPATGPLPLTVTTTVAYVGVGQQLYALNASTGAVLWHKALAKGKSPPTVDSLAVNGAVVYASGWSSATSTTVVYALNASTGAPLWASTALAGSGLLTYSAGSPGALLVGAEQLDTLNANTGAVEWSFQGPPQDPFYTNRRGPPLVANGVVYGSCMYWNDGDNLPHQSLWAVTASTGVARWSFDEGPTGTGGNGVLLANSLLFNGGSNLFAVDASSGAQVWENPLGYDMTGPVDTDGALFTFGNGLFAVNELSGALLWRDAATENGNGTFSSDVSPVVGP